MTKDEITQLFKARQSVVFVCPTQAAATNAYFDATQHKLPEPEDMPINYFPQILSITQDNPAKRQPTILRWMSGNTRPEEVRGMKAVIEFPMGPPRGPYYSLWQEAQAIQERHRMTCRICSDRATQTRGEYHDVPVCGNPTCVETVDEENY